MSVITRALVVDDSKSARFSLKKILKKQGIESTFAESGASAIDALQTETPDIIFMDHMMPGMDGLEATQAIKNNPETHNIPVVMCTSRDGEAYEAEARAHGATAVIPKPAPDEQVAKLLAELAQLTKPLSKQPAASKEAVESLPPQDNATMDVNEQPNALSGTEQLEQKLSQKIQTLFNTQASSTSDALNKHVRTLTEQYGERLSALLTENTDARITSLSKTVTEQLEAQLEAQMEKQLAMQIEKQAAMQIENSLKAANEQLTQKLQSQQSREIEQLNNVVAEQKAELLSAITELSKNDQSLKLAEQQQAEISRWKTLSLISLTAALCALGTSAYLLL